MIKKILGFVFGLVAIVSIVLIVSSFIDAIRDAKGKSSFKFLIFVISFLGDSWEVFGLLFLTTMLSLFFFLD